MRRADRLLQIIQILRRSAGIVTANQLAEELEVTVRTIYRDMIAVEAMGAPVRGEAGVGYILEEGYDLPPMMFNLEELEAVMLGLRFVDGHGDETLRRSAKDVVAKIHAVLPKHLKAVLEETPLIAPKFSIDAKAGMGDIRLAIRNEQTIEIEYEDAIGQSSCRKIYPILIGFFSQTQVVVAYCTIREDFRSFRLDRIKAMKNLEERYPIRRRQLLTSWRKIKQNESYVPHDRPIRGTD